MKETTGFNTKNASEGGGGAICRFLLGGTGGAVTLPTGNGAGGAGTPSSNSDSELSCNKKIHGL